MTQVKIGFVGVGSMGQCAHLRHYMNLPDCKVVAISDIQPSLATNVGSKYGISKVYGDGAKMLESEDLDAVVCIQQFTMHGSILPMVYKKGKPVLTEKPLAGSVPVARKMLDALKASGARHLVGYHKRSDPAVMWAQKKIAEWKASGEVGKMTYVRITMPPGDWIAGGFNWRITSTDPWPKSVPDPKPEGWSDEYYKKYVGFVNYYIHQVNLLRHLLGDDYKVTHADKPGRLLVAETPGGVTGVIEMAPFSTTVDWQEQALVCFEKGWLKMELPAPVTLNRSGRATAYKDDGKSEPVTVSPTLPWVDAMQQQAKHFVAAAQGKETPLCEAVNAIKDLETAEEYLVAHEKALKG